MAALLLLGWSEHLQTLDKQWQPIKCGIDWHWKTNCPLEVAKADGPDCWNMNVPAAARLYFACAPKKCVGQLCTFFAALLSKSVSPHEFLKAPDHTVPWKWASTDQSTAGEQRTVFLTKAQPPRPPSDSSRLMQTHQSHTDPDCSNSIWSCYNQYLHSYNGWKSRVWLVSKGNIMVTKPHCTNTLIPPVLYGDFFSAFGHFATVGLLWKKAWNITGR